MKRKIATLTIIAIFIFSIVGALAQQVNYQYKTQSQKQEMLNTQNKFQTRYNFTCEEICEQKQLDNSTYQLEIKTQKRLLFFNVESIETYNMNQEGELIQARYNIWSRLLNRDRIIE